MKQHFYTLSLVLLLLMTFHSLEVQAVNNNLNDQDTIKNKNKTHINSNTEILNQTVNFNYSTFYLNKLNLLSEDLILQNIPTYSFNTSMIQRGLTSSDFSIVYKGIKLNKSDITDKIIPSWSGIANSSLILSDFNYSSNISGISTGTYNLKLAKQNRMSAETNISTVYPNFGTQAGFTFNSGQLKNGLNITFATSGILANQAYIEGTGLNMFDYFTEISMNIGNKQQISLSLFGNDYYGLYSTMSVNEVYELRNNNFYNPCFGYWNDNMLSANYSFGNNNNGILNHTWELSEKNALSTSIAYFTGKTAISELEIYNAPNPYPTYYNNLPGFYNEDSYMFSYLTEQWTNEPDFYRINWDDIYHWNTVNLYMIEGAEGIMGNNATGNRAKYYISEHNQSDNTIQASTQLTHTTENSQFITGVYFNNSKQHYYKSMASLLGADFHLDIDAYAEQTSFEIDPQNDLQIPNNLIYEADTFGFDYLLTENQIFAFFNSIKEYETTLFSLSGNLGYKQSYRTGNMQYFYHPDISLGKGQLISGIEYQLNGLIKHSIGEHHTLIAKASLNCGLPEYLDIYLYPTVSDSTRNYDNYSSLNSDITYRYTGEKLRFQIAAFFNKTYNYTSTIRFFESSLNQPVAVAIDSINTLRTGIEFYSEYNFAKSFYLFAGGTIGLYKYSNRPMMDIYMYYSDQVFLENETIYITNYKIPNIPQAIINAGISYYNSKKWFASINANYYDNIYGGFAPECRTEYVSNIFGYESPTTDSFFSQKKLNGGLKLDISGGKSFELIKNKTSLQISLSIKNILNNQNIAISSFEANGISSSSRLSYNDRYAYLNGRIFLLKLSVSL